MADGATFRTGTEGDIARHGLTYCSDEMGGIRRLRAGRGFRYVDQDNTPVRDPDTLQRIKALAIPPAWKDVWICAQATGHIQATGRDEKGRKQYRYHASWTSLQAEEKFTRLIGFARRLPRLRDAAERDLSRRGPCREKVCATVVRLLEITLIRVGNATYARQNRSYGLTTLHKRHIEVDGTGLQFAFRGKSGVEHRLSVRDRRLARIVRSLHELPGQHLFKYRDEDGDMVPLTSDAVNAYIREHIGESFSAKDFRTWAGTLSAARFLRDQAPPSCERSARRTVAACVRDVSRRLGNTPAVCRSSYVHPRVIELYEAGALCESLPGSRTKGFEVALIRLLDKR
ncbi:MAG: DNA topoisomerase IB [Brevundimonas sp.]|jgi:DNA topoisomerase I|uniref:DNA topoisomerase IB n=1 Tax=Brevundimonas sp. TaxID=1871086 RepID=UPI0039191C6C